MGDINFNTEMRNVSSGSAFMEEYGNWGMGSMMGLMKNVAAGSGFKGTSNHSNNHHVSNAEGFVGDVVATRDGVSVESSLSSRPSFNHNQEAQQSGFRVAAAEENASASCSINTSSNPNTNTNNNNSNGFEVPIDALKTRIAAHPRYPRLLAAYMDCQKIGAPPEVAAMLQEFTHQHERQFPASAVDAGIDPELDQFMEAFIQLLEEFRVELSKPYGEAMEFLRKMETDLNSLSIGGGPNVCVNSGQWEESAEQSSEEDMSRDEMMEVQQNDHIHDRELKEQLLRKYIGYFSTLKQEFLKKKKKGKLPKEARQQLLDWWEAHYSWPYPSEIDKAALAESTGLDQKQINNWFINQRKRHWKPSEDMQFFW